MLWKRTIFHAMAFPSIIIIILKRTIADLRWKLKVEESKSCSRNRKIIKQFQWLDFTKTKQIPNTQNISIWATLCVWCKDSNSFPEQSSHNYFAYLHSNMMRWPIPSTPNDHHFLYKYRYNLSHFYP